MAAGKNVEDQIDRHLETGYSALERGELGAAKKAAQAALALDAQIAEAHTLLGAVAERNDDVDAARKAYAAARKADPAAFEPVLALAELEYATGAAEKARQLFAQAIEVAEEEEEYVEGLLARAEFELAEGDAAAALEALNELPPVELPEPNDHLRAGDALRQAAAQLPAEAGKILTEAERHFTLVQKGDHGDAAIRADAIYGSALVAEARGEREAMIARFSEVLELDVKEGRPPWALSEARMEEVVEHALEELPERARELLSNVPIVIEVRPTRAQVKEGLDPRLLGLFSGPSIRDSTDGATLQQITLFSSNLERAAANVDELEDEVRITLLHETGHFFGLDEDGLAELGLD